MTTEERTVNYHEFVRSLVVMGHYQSYLELGVDRGDLLAYIAPVVRRAVGVDITDHRRQPVGEFYEQDTNTFFSWCHDLFEVIFVDADHASSQVQRDTENALTILAPGGVVLLHDTDPACQFLCTPVHCNDAYKAVDWLQKEHPELDVCVLKTDCAGLTIVRRRADRRVKAYT